MTDFNTSKYGTLYIVATPIGGMGDVTINAMEVLKKVDKIICEDTRVTSKFLTHYNIKKALLQYHDHSNEAKEDEISFLLKKGLDLAIVSDAGTPLISDPGYKLVKKVIEHGFDVKSIPGPCSAICALTISGLPSDKFLFFGFLPSAENARKKELEKLKELEYTLIFFESAKRIEKSLKNMLEIFGNRNISISRELTKFFEETKRDRIEKIIDDYREKLPKGELVIVVEGKSKNEELDYSKISNMLEKLMLNMSLKESVTEVSENLEVKKKIVYEIALKIKKSS